MILYINKKLCYQLKIDLLCFWSCNLIICLIYVKVLSTESPESSKVSYFWGAFLWRALKGSLRCLSNSMMKERESEKCEKKWHLFLKKDKSLEIWKYYWYNIYD